MTELIQSIFGYAIDIESEIYAIVGIFLRVGGAMAFLPGLSEHTVPVRIRLVITVCMAVLLRGQGAQNLSADISSLYYINEVATGLAIGFFFRIFLFSIEVFGHVVSNAISMAQVFPTGAEVSPVIFTMVKYAATLLMMNLGIFNLYCDTLLLGAGKSSVPVILDSSYWLLLFLPKMAECLGLALVMSTPFLIFSTLYNMVLGVMNRIMPSLMVHLIFAPALALVGLALLSMIASYSLMQWVELVL